MPGIDWRVRGVSLGEPAWYEVETPHSAGDVKQSKGVNMNWAFGMALACLVAWIALAFIWAMPSGWVHLPLAAGTVLIAKGIVDRDRAVRGNGPGPAA